MAGAAAGIGSLAAREPVVSPEPPKTAQGPAFDCRSIFPSIAGRRVAADTKPRTGKMRTSALRRIVDQLVTVKVVVALSPEVRPIAVIVNTLERGPGPVKASGLPTKLPLAFVSHAKKGRVSL